MMGITPAEAVPVFTSSLQPVIPPDAGQEETVEEAEVARAVADLCPSVGPEITPAIPATPTDGAGLGRDHRLSRRRFSKGGVRVELRQGALGLGPNLATGLVDLSADGAGAGLRLKAEVSIGEEVEVGFGRVGGGKMLTIRAVVRWCRPDPDGGFLVGLVLRRRLTHANLLDLAR